jgi:hypothetical protein
MPRIIADEAEVITALNTFSEKARGEGALVNIDDVDYDLLTDAVNEEYLLGQRGDVIDVLTDINDTIGLEVFGLVYH